MIRFASSESICRNQFLLGYFGQIKVPRCGRCDVCLEKKELKPGSPEFTELKSAILDLLAGGGKELESMVDSIPGDPQQIIQVLEYLIESGVLIRGADLRIALK